MYKKEKMFVIKILDLWDLMWKWNMRTLLDILTDWIQQRKLAKATTNIFFHSTCLSNFVCNLGMSMMHLNKAKKEEKLLRNN